MSDRDVTRFLGLRGHWTPGLVIDRRGSLYATIRIGGIPSDLAGVDAIVAASAQDNALMLGVSGPRLEWWEHYCLLDGQTMPQSPTIPNWFAARFDEAYRQMQSETAFFEQVLLLTLVWHPNDSVGRTLAEASDREVAQFETLIGRVYAGLGRRYTVERLELRDDLYSAIGEALFVVMNNRRAPVPLSEEALGPCIVRDRIVFGFPGGEVPAGVFKIVRERAPVFGAVLTWLMPPARSRPIMLDELRAKRIPITITNSAVLSRRGAAVKDLHAQERRMESAGDASVKQRQELANEAEKLEDGEVVRVSHHFSVAVFAPDIETLSERVADVQGALSDVGITVERQTDALKPSYYAQLPNNERWRVRRDPLKSSNMLALAAKHAGTAGEKRSRWGAPIIYIRSTAGVAIPFHWQVRPTPQMPKADLGHTKWIGRSGSGKTAAMGTFALCSLRVPGIRVVILDRDLGLYPLVRATGGPYLRPRLGSRSGWAPLRGLSDTDADRTFLWGFIHDLILSDERGPITGEEGGWLHQGIEREMRKPASQRGLANIGAVLGFRDRNGAAARLRPWCRGEARGWAFDGEEDDAHKMIGAQFSGCDTTHLLSDKMLCGPALSYTFHLVNRLVNGKPLLLMLDEAWAANQVPAFQERNNTWLKTGRKEEIVLSLATQSSGDILKSPIRDTLLQQMPRTIYFGEEKPDPNQLVGPSGMGLTDAGYRVVTEVLPNLAFSFLVQQPGGGYIGQLDLSSRPDLVAMISGRSSTAALLDDLVAKYGDDPPLWVPEFQRLAPGVVDEPTLDRAQ